MSKEKIGVGIITCNRNDSFLKSFNSIDKSAIDCLVVVNDGDCSLSVDCSNVINHPKNMGVGVSKNDAFKYLINQKCEHIFLIEDDVVIKDNTVFEKYVETSKETKIKHFMWGFHGPANRHPLRYETETPQKIVKYKNCSILLNLHCVGAFCYYTKDLLTKVGLMDETFKNAWEHVEHSYRIVKAGYLPGYWWWPDIQHSSNYLQETNNSMNASVISTNKNHHSNIIEGIKHFEQLHEYSPVNVPRISLKEALSNLKSIYKLNT